MDFLCYFSTKKMDKLWVSYAVLDVLEIAFLVRFICLSKRKTSVETL